LSNQFDRDNYPVQEPDRLVTGDRFAWQRPDLVSDYPLADYTMTYHFSQDSGGGGTHHFTLSSTEADDNYYFEKPSSETTNLTAGDWEWQLYAIRTSDSERVTLDYGITKFAIGELDTNNDLRSHAKKVLDAIEAVIEGRATIDQSSFSLGGRSLSRLSVDELMTFRDRYHAEYLKEVKLARIRNKQGSGNTIKVNFGSSTGSTPKSYT